VAAPSPLTLDSVVLPDGLLAVTYAVKNVVTGAWDAVGTKQKVGNADVEASLVVPSPADHIDANGLVQLRINGKGSVAKNPFGFPSLGMDYVEMTVVE
jgi:hypothetical protein